jgi:hypothetical protein
LPESTLLFDRGTGEHLELFHKLIDDEGQFRLQEKLYNLRKEGPICLPRVKHCEASREGRCDFSQRLTLLIESIRSKMSRYIRLSPKEALYTAA